jgi:hypothetical protein
MAARTAARFVQRRLLSSGGKVLSEEEKAAENVYIKVQISPLPPSPTLVRYCGLRFLIGDAIPARGVCVCDW